MRVSRYQRPSHRTPLPRPHARRPLSGQPTIAARCLSMPYISDSWSPLTAQPCGVHDDAVNDSVDDTFIGTFQWIPATENGPTMPSARPKLSGFAYVEPRRDVEGAILLRG